MAYDQSVRKLLSDQGINGADIGYDNKSGFVTVKGQQFMRPEKNIAGTSYTDPTSFQTAWNAYSKANPTRQYQGDIFTAVGADLPYDQRIASYAADPTQGNAEYERAMKAYNTYVALGDTQKAQSAQNHMNRVKTALGSSFVQAMPTGPKSQADNQVESLLSQVLQQLNTPSNYDPYSSSEYAAAKAQADQAATRNVRSAQEALGSAGFGRSTVLGGQAQQAQNNATEYLMTQVIPQLIAQNSAREQQSFNNMISALSPLQQQQLLGDQRTQRQVENVRNSRLDNWNAAQDISLLTGRLVSPQEDWSGLYRQANNPNTPMTMEGRNSNLSNDIAISQITGTFRGQKTTAEQQRQLGNLWTLADQTGTIGKELADIYGIDEGTPTLQGKQMAIAQEQLKLAISEVTGYYNGKKTTKEEQRWFENQWALSMGMGTVTDELATAYGIPKGTSLINGLQLALDQARLAHNIDQDSIDNQFKQDAADLNWAQFDANQDGKIDAGMISKFTPSQVKKDIMDQYTTGSGATKKTNLPDKPTIFKKVVGYMMDETNTIATLKSFGLTDKEINHFKDLYIKAPK